MSRTVTVRYSEGFKFKVVEEYESGRYSLTELQERYGIGGKCTLVKWIRKMGRNDLLGKKVKVMEINEQSEIEALKEQVRQLQKVVSAQKIEVLALESLFEVAGEEFGAEFKKNCLRKLPAEVRKKLNDL